MAKFKRAFFDEECREKHYAFFSNVGNEDPNQFYLLLTCHKSEEGGFGTSISIEKCKRLVKRENKNYYFQDVS